MSEMDKHMDEAFKRMSEELRTPYNASFWKDAALRLDDAEMDDAFRSAAETVASPSIVAPMLDDLFMDAAFKDAAISSSVTYDANYFEQFQEVRGEFEMNEAFLTASNDVVVDYHPEFWNDADQALQQEGLHYEYKPAYWEEAKAMLEKKEKRAFFLRWSAAAIALLFISSLGLIQSSEVGELNNQELAYRGEDSKINHSAKEGWNNYSSDRSHSENNVQWAVENHSVGTNEYVEQVVLPGVNPQAVSENNTATQLSNTNNSASANDLVNTITIEEQSQQRGNMNMFDLRNPDLITQSIASKEYYCPEIELKKYTSPADHIVSYVGQIGLGNKYGQPSLIPTWRNSWGLEYTYVPRGSGSLRNFEFSTSLLVNHVRQNNLGTERRVKVFGEDGGVAQFWYKLQLKDLFYGNINASAAYRVDRHQKIKVGIGIERRLFVQSNMSYQINEDVIKTVNNNWGVTNGINKWDARLSLGYEYSFNRLSFLVTGNYSIFDRTDNAFMQSEIRDHEMNVMVGVKYALFRKI